MLSRTQLAPCSSAPVRRCASTHSAVVSAVEAPPTRSASSTAKRQRSRRSSTQHSTQQLPQLVPLSQLQPRIDTSATPAVTTHGSAAQQVLQQQTGQFLVPVKLQPQQQSMLGQQQPRQESNMPSADTMAQQHTEKQTIPAAGGGDSDAAAAGKPAWALAVDKRVAALPGTRSARTARWSRTAAPRAARHQTIDMAASRQGSDSASSSSLARGHNNRGAAAGSLLAHSSISRLLQGGELDAEGEQQLCLAYQRYVQLQQIMAVPHQAQQVLQAAAQGHRQQHGASAAGPGLPDIAALQTLLRDPGSIQREGLMAREMLLQAYEPLLINRVRRVQSAHTDSRELMAAARQGLLKAAARFDLQRVMRGRDRLYALAENYIRNALRDVLTEYQTAVVHVPTHVREVAAKLHRVEQQLRQKHPGKDPTLDEIAAAAGVSLTQAQRALQATGGALQAMSLQSSADQPKEDRGKAGSGMDLQQIDVSTEQDRHELSGVVGAGGLAAARSGLHEELDAAAEQAAVTELLQGLMAKLDHEDRRLLQLKLDGGNVSQAARELGKSKQWGSVAVDKAVKKLREDVQQHAKHDLEVAELLRSQ